MKTNENDLAYPCDGQYAFEARNSNDAGLTKLELFSAMAMQWFVSNKNIIGLSFESITNDSVLIAKTLIK